MSLSDEYDPFYDWDRRADFYISEVQQPEQTQSATGKSAGHNTGGPVLETVTISMNALSLDDRRKTVDHIMQYFRQRLNSKIAVTRNRQTSSAISNSYLQCHPHSSQFESELNSLNQSPKLSEGDVPVELLIFRQAIGRPSPNDRVKPLEHGSLHHEWGMVQGAYGNTKTSIATCAQATTHSDNRGNRNNGSKKRGGSDDSDHDGRRKRQKQQPDNTTKPEHCNGRKFACPYFKKNPHKYSRWTSCPGPGWDEVHRVK